MWQNYIRVAWRNLAKGRLYSLINIFGLSIGAAVCILIMLYVSNEWSYDRFHTKSERTYRMWVKEHFRGDIFFNTVTPLAMGQALRDNFPQVEKVARYTSTNVALRQGSFMDREVVHYADPAFLDVFDFPLIKGNRASVLSDLHAVVLTEKAAQKYFGDAAPLGRTLSFQQGDGWQDFVVTGIISPAPVNSSIQYEVIVPMQNFLNALPKRALDCWTCVFCETYAVLRDGVDGGTMQATAAPFFNRQVADDYQPGQYEVGFQPLTDLHLNNAMPLGIVPVSDGRYPYILGGVALLILLLAGVNFVTLAVGRSLTRAKEVGIRKSTGASRRQLMLQFWTEAILTALISVGFGVVLAKVLLPLFNTLSGQALVFPLSATGALFAFGLALLVGLIAGLYPALLMSGFSPIASLRGALLQGRQGKPVLLKSLVTIQFFVSLLLLVATFVMQRQMTYLQNKNLGFDRDGTVVVPYNTDEGPVKYMPESRRLAALFKTELAGIPAVRNVTTSNHSPGTPGWTTLGYTDASTNKFRSFSLNGVDENFIPALHIDLAAGRNFSKNYGDIDKSVIINEAYAREFGIQNPVGKFLQEPFRDFQIIGVAKDFHFASLHQKVAPLVLAYDPVALNRIASDRSSIDAPTPKFSFRVSRENLPATLAALQSAWKTLLPNQPFTYTFLDDDLNKLYEPELRMSRIMGAGTLLAICIACLGLFGIATFTVSRRTKEIGIRKVMGAGVGGVVGLLSRDFMLLVGIAFVLATPVAWWAMHTWLGNFAYHVPLDWWVFPAAGALAAAVAFLTVGVQCVKAALANPVESLRSE